MAGYTAWKSLMFLTLAGAVWGLLTGTKLLRGEEDAGRWELLLAGQTTRRGAVRQALAGLGAGAGRAVGAHRGDHRRGRAASEDRHPGRPGAVLRRRAVAPAAMFLAVGALASQLAGTRRQAAGYAGAVLGVAYAIRMVADSGTGLQWLRWVTPLGWVEELRPLTGPRPLALLPIVALVVVLGGAGGVPGRPRDLGASVLPDRASAPPHTRLLGGPAGLAVRLARPATLGWAAAIGALALLMGFIAKQGGKALTSSPSAGRVFARLGRHGGSPRPTSASRS